jgi:hypothetical protein
MTDRVRGPYQLFLISQNTVSGYDTFDDAVVVAVDEEGAKHVSPCDYYVWKDNDWHFKFDDGTTKAEPYHGYSWCQPKDVTATWVGVAAANLKLGEVVCASFNAG